MQNMQIFVCGYDSSGSDQLIGNSDILKECDAAQLMHSQADSGGMSVRLESIRTQEATRSSGAGS